MDKKLYRSRSDRILGGVCGGIAHYFDVDPTIIRLLAVALIFAGGAAVIAYILAWIIVPEEPRKRKVEEQQEEREKGEEEERIIDIETEERKDEHRNRNLDLLAWVLVIIGVVWIARYAFTWWWPSLFAGGRFFTPVVLIILGIVVLLWRKRET